MQTLTKVNYMNNRKSKPSPMDAFALRGFVLSLVDGLQATMSPSAPWKTRDEGLVLIEEILLEGHACGICSRDGFEELCRTVLAFQIKLPFSRQIRQALTRPGLTEMQCIEGLRLCLINHRGDNPLPQLPQISRN